MTRLTKLQREILNHRLAAPDVIFSVLWDDGHDFDAEAVDDACRHLMAGDDLQAAFDRSVADCGRAVTEAVLRDAVEGSTWVGTIDGLASPNSVAAACRAGNQLAKIVGRMIRENLIFPEF